MCPTRTRRSRREPESLLMSHSPKYILFSSLMFAAGLSALAGETKENAPLFPAPLQWVSSGPLIGPVSDAAHALVAVKDPTAVFYHGRWHVYATTANTKGEWSMAYFSFANWSEASAAKPYYLDQNPNLTGYHCAPQLLYFRPQKKWYLLFQSQQPQYSTADDPGKPETWSKPQNFFPIPPPSIAKDLLWLDYWMICDEEYAYLFFCGDNGKFYRSRTKLADFPHGFSDPVVALQRPERFALFEGDCVYRIKGTGKYLALIEAFSSESDERRFYKGFIADRLDGEWTPLADTWENPFAGISNVRFDTGVKPWTVDISHGELLRENYDETPTIDPANLQLLYQGRDPASSDVKDYSQRPYRLGLLKLAK